MPKKASVATRKSTARGGAMKKNSPQSVPKGRGRPKRVAQETEEPRERPKRSLLSLADEGAAMLAELMAKPPPTDVVEPIPAPARPPAAPSPKRARKSASPTTTDSDDDAPSEHENLPEEEMKELSRPNVKEASAEERALASKVFGTRIRLDSGTSSEEEGDEDKAENRETPAQDSAVWKDADDVDDGKKIKVRAGHRGVRSTEATQKISKTDYAERLRADHARAVNLVGKPKWAQRREKPTEKSELGNDDGGDDDDDDEEEEAIRTLVRSTKNSAGGSARNSLPRNSLQLTCLAADMTTSGGDRRLHRPLSILVFHPQRRVLMAGGAAGAVVFYEINPQEEKTATHRFLQSATIANFPITSAGFTGGISQDDVLLGSTRQEYLIRYSLTTGRTQQIRLPPHIPRQNAGKFVVSESGDKLALLARNGAIYLLATASMTVLRQLTVRTNAVSAVFSTSGADLFVAAEDGEITRFDVSSDDFDENARFHDEGAIQSTVLAISKNARLLAAGSNTGVVNVYDTAARENPGNSRKPLFAVTNLVTSCTALAFNHTGQLLALASNVKKDQIRLVNTATHRVYADSPPKADGTFGQVERIAFSPGGGYMAVSSTNGRIRLYRIHHYDGY